MDKKQKTQSFMGNVIMILFAQIMVKMLGLVYRMVITNIDGFGNSGNGFYNAGFQVYTVLLAISSVGIPNAIAKMVSERAALGDYKSAHRIFVTAFKLFSAVGLICAALLYIGSEFVAKYVVNMDGAQYVMRALAPSIFFVCVSSVIRGYFQGLNDMRATSFSQMLEQVFKCGLTIVLVVAAVGSMPAFMAVLTKLTMLYDMGRESVTPPEILAAWANAASSLATLISFIYLVFFYNRRKKGIYESIGRSSAAELTTSTRGLIKMILMLSVPISLASIITAVNRVVDLATITRGIEAAFASGIPARAGQAAIAHPTAAQLNKEAVFLSGMLSKSDTIFNMPLALNIAFATVLVPSIAGALAKGDTAEASSKTSYSFLISILLILPCAIGFITLAQPIYKIIYPATSDGADLLAIMAVALIFSALTQTLTGALQGIGKVFIPAIGILAGCVCKVALNIVLISMPSVNIYGAAISSIACQLVAFLVNFMVLIRYIPLRITAGKFVVKPLMSGAAMGIAAFGVYRAMFAVLGAGYVNNLIASAAAIAVAAVVYLGFVLRLHIMNRDDILLLPAGERIYSLLVRRGIYKES
ncbi:MAG: polysaccharide biosynthesis protein [Clostridia bacterium]|nr:polysaccharide biosynthesis protein [Clostridia bacterium]